MKTPTVGRGYHPFKRVIMRCRAQEEKRYETSLPVTNPGLVEDSLRGRRCAGRGNPVALGDLYAARWVGAQQDTGQKGDPYGDTETGHGPGLHVRVPLVLTCLRTDYRIPPTMVKAKKSASDTTGNRSK